MERIFEACPIVVSIRTVTHNAMKKGHYPRRPSGRYSDCLVYIVNGDAHYTFENYTIDVSTDCILYLAYDCLYTIDVKSDIFDVIFVDFDFLYNCDTRYRSEAVGNIEAKSKGIFENMLKTWLKKSPGYIQAAFASVYSILSLIAEIKGSSYLSGKSSSAIAASVEYMKEHFDDPELNMDRIASFSGITRTHFGRVFKSIYKVSPKKYLEFLRFERAKELLLTENIPISEIAYMCGFSDAYYFSRVFKREFGISPGKYSK